MLMTLLQAGQETSGHFQAGRVVGSVIVIAVVLILVIAVIKLVVKKQRERE